MNPTNSAVDKLQPGSLSLSFSLSHTHTQKLIVFSAATPQRICIPLLLPVATHTDTFARRQAGELTGAEESVWILRGQDSR